MLELIALLVPLSLDSFAVAAALGLSGVSRSAAFRVSLVLAGFEAGMPLVGVAIGHGAGTLAETVAADVAGAILVLLGGSALLAGESDDQRARRLTGAHGLALVALGIAVSIDELVIGLSIGLLDLPLTPTLIVIARAGVRSGAAGPPARRPRRRAPP